MKIFSGVKNNISWGSKTNFVDINNVFVGYDEEQSCCEDAGYFISEDPNEPFDYEGNSDLSDDLEDYVFDSNYIDYVISPHLDEGGAQVAFKIIADSKPDLYIHLYNSHNGYYSHGFEFGDGDKIIKEGSL